ncbi:MAG: hypothetical protein ACM30E_05770 [Nitrososphaerales archaeon]
MAKQQKKNTARRAPRASEPRMYGDGKPSQPAQAQPPATASSPSTVAPTRAPAARTAGVTPRGAGATGAYTRVDRITDYSYVMGDLRRLGITAVIILAGLVTLGFIVR